MRKESRRVMKTDRKLKNLNLCEEQFQAEANDIKKPKRYENR